MAQPPRQFGGSIRRGPMAADAFQAQFTQIHNALFRDRRLSFKAKGIFGLISTHRDGFGISQAAIASFATDGVAAVGSGLKELIGFGYLQRERKRNELGQLGEAEYFITDMPQGLILTFDPGFDPLDQGPGAGERNRRSEPGCGNRTQEPAGQTPRSEPKCGFPKQGEPTLENRLHKKTTTSKKTNKTKNDAAAPRSGGTSVRTSTSGSSAREARSGSAASATTPPRPDQSEADPGRPQGGRAGGGQKARHAAAELAIVRSVRAFYPPELLGVLPELPRVSSAILSAMRTDGRTAEQLGERIGYRWIHHGFAAKHAAGKLSSPVGAAVAMVRPLRRGDRYACADARCENGRDVITGVECRLCEVRITDQKAARRPREGLAGTPGGNSPSTGPAQAAEGRSGRLKDCEEPSCRQPIPATGGPLCSGCVIDAQEAHDAAQAAAARWEAEADNPQPVPGTDPQDEEDAATARLRARIAGQWGTPEELAAYGHGTEQ
ncbi:MULTISPECIES: hypothetical protein [Streptomyces]|uniref:Helix-turn-helix domain-containing protein n=1 Tax=Streptomyces clavifer TaxID=68188 RepID=A0ABS4VIH6_9ACTN|nr:MULTISPECIES: hypothetical protein [Streptomyces]MBP2363399.1 hypothetical protein [Streptomyces clavifer]